MKSHQLSLFTILVLTCFQINAQSLVNEAYGYLGVDVSRGNKIVRTADGNFLLGGESNGGAFLIKVDCGGRLLGALILGDQLGQLSGVNDLIIQTDGSIVVAGTCKNCVASDTLGRVFVLKTDANLVLDETTGIKFFADPNQPNSAIVNYAAPSIARLGNGNFVMAYQDDFFGGNLDLVLLDDQLNYLTGQFHHFAFIESAPSVTANGNGFTVAETAFTFGETYFGSVSHYALFSDPPGFSLSWERKIEASPRKILTHPNGKLYLAATQPYSGLDSDVMVMELDPDEQGTPSDSIFFDLYDIGLNDAAADLRITANGSLILAQTASTSPFTAACVRLLDVAPLAQIQEEVILPQNGTFIMDARSIVPISPSGSGYAMTGVRDHTANRTFFYQKSALSCAPNSVVLEPFDYCDGNSALIENDIQTHPLSQPFVYNDVVYGSGIDVHGNNEPLELDVYVPRDLHYSNSDALRPLFVWVHGGAYVAGDEDVYGPVCIDFTQKGFISASVSYRLGMPNADVCSNSWEEFLKAAYRSAQDVRKALRFLYDNAAQYHINRNQIYLGGFSAGAGTTLHAAFLDDGDLQFLPAGIQALGGLAAPVPLAGVCIYGGAGAIDLGIIENDEQIPVFLVHGTCDPIAPFDENFVLCPNWPVVSGALQVAQQLYQEQVPLSFQVYRGAGHGVEGGDEVAMYDNLREYLKNNLICGDPPVYECADYGLDTLPCAMGDFCAVVTTGLQEQVRVHPLTVFPNPATDQVTISGLESSGEAVLRSMDGRVVRTIRLETGNNPVSLNGLPKGLYIIECRMPHGIAIGRVVKQ